MPKSQARQAIASDDLATRARLLREALKLTQQDVADASGERLERPEVNKIESGRNKATSDKIRAGLAMAYGVDRDTMADYLDGRLDLREVLSRRQKQAAQVLVVVPDDRYQGRAKAAVFADGQVATEAIKSVLVEQLDFAEDPGPEFWWERMKQRDRELKVQRRNPSAGEPSRQSDIAFAQEKAEATRPKLPRKKLEAAGDQHDPAIVVRQGHVLDGEIALLWVACEAP